MSLWDDWASLEHCELNPKIAISFNMIILKLLIFGFQFVIGFPTMGMVAETSSLLLYSLSPALGGFDQNITAKKKRKKHLMFIQKSRSHRTVLPNGDEPLLEETILLQPGQLDMSTRALR